MAKDFITLEELREIIRAKLGDDPQRCLATELGITQQHLSSIFNGKRNPGKKLLRHFGYERIFVYTKKK